MLKDGFLYITMIYDNETVISCIREFIEEKRREKGIVNRVRNEAWPLKIWIKYFSILSFTFAIVIPWTIQLLNGFVVGNNEQLAK